MGKSLKLYTVIGLLLLCSSLFSGNLLSRPADSYLYETYAPVKETLLFLSDNRCVYTYYDVLKNKEIADTCLWRLTKDNNIILYKGITGVCPALKCMEDSAEIAQMNFTYEICPKWYDIKKREFQKHAAYRSPIWQDRSISLPLGTSPEERAQIIKGLHPTFAEKYGQYRIASDTIVNFGSFLMWQKKSGCASFLFASNKQIPQKIDVPDYDYIKEAAFSLPNTSYEFLNYHINYGNSIEIDQDSIIGKQFSFIGDSCKKESIQFINDSVCTHSVSTRGSVSSTFVTQESDSCRYSVQNNLIAIDLVKGKSCDTLTYGNGILFYSKVYKNDRNGELTHIVKPFIDETRSCANKADSINMIMSTYFKVYVPINLSN